MTASAAVPLISVVIPCKDAAATLPEQLDALLAQHDPPAFEVIAVDNGSRDATASILAEYAARDPRISIVVASDRPGANYARDRGVAVARGDDLAFCDADDVVSPTWLRSLATALRDHECVTGPLDTSRLNPAWVVRTRGALPPDRPRCHLGVVPVVPGGNMAIRRDTLVAIGGFREELDTAGEDVELSLRLLRHGVPLHFAPDAVVCYRYRTEPRALFRQGWAYGRAKPWLCSLVRDAGLANPSRTAGLKSWLLLVAWLPRVRTREGRASWCWVAGSRLGQVQGCFRHRSFWL